MQRKMLILPMIAGALLAGPVAYAQTTPTHSAKETHMGTQRANKQKTESPTPVGPGSGAYKQKAESPTPVGPGSGAYKQKAESPTPVGPGSGAYKHQ